MSSYVLYRILTTYVPTVRRRQVWNYQMEVVDSTKIECYSEMVVYSGTVLISFKLHLSTTSAYLRLPAET